MRRTLFVLSVLTGIPVALQAQSTQTSGQQPGAPTAQTSTTSTNQQSWTGVLMDASCNVIASTAKAAGTTSSTGVKTYTGTPSPSSSSNTAASAAGTTTESTDVAPARSTTEATAAAASTGERSRTASSDATGTGSLTTVREKYRDCMVKPTTTSFAIHSAGKLIVLDEESNQVVRRQMMSDHFHTRMTDSTGNPKWMSVTLSGSMKGDRLTVTSVGK